MSTSVKISDADKRKLEKLQALVTIKKSKKVTQQEILSELISEAVAQGNKFVDRAFEETVPISDEGFQRILSLTSDWGIKTKWEEIDKEVYGDNTRSQQPTGKRSHNK